MEQYIIKGGTPLVGEVVIGGAKNAALAILAAAIMTDETVHIDNLPDVNDINVLLEAMEGIGARIKRKRLMVEKNIFLYIVPAYIRICKILTAIPGNHTIRKAYFQIFVL